MTFCMPQRGSSAGNGSSGKTSSAAPAIFPSCNALIKLAWSIILPREISIKYAPAFITEKAGAAKQAFCLAGEW